MRDINWDEPLSDEDKDWVRQAGFPMVEQRIAENERRFGDEPSAVSNQDPRLRSALDPTATTNEGAVPTANTPMPTEPDQPDDDYDDWSVKELEAEVSKRNEDPDNEDQVIVTGTGKGGSVRKPDLIAGLRAWDRDHPSDE